MDYALSTLEEAGRTRVALLAGERLLEYYEDAPQSERVVGSVFLGRVERVLPDMGAAFVSIGLKQSGFLHLKEAQSFHRAGGDAPLMSGQTTLVQARKAPKGGKGAFLTRDISLPGQYVLVMPCNRFVGISKRIQQPEHRARALQLGERAAQSRFGVIVRHAALFADENQVLEEAEALWALWQSIQDRAAREKAPCLLHAEASMAEVLRRDYSARHSVAEVPWPDALVRRQLRQALDRRVELPGGGSLVIDEREALQTIDVNSGRTVKAQSLLGLPLEENLRAIPEIARQIRLRNLSGIILVDFIDMPGEEERRQVQARMEEALADDRVKNVVHGFTRLGLLEMTRKRTGESLRDLLTSPCERCGEAGRVPRGD